MGKPFIRSRKDLVEAHARAIQFLTGSAVVTLSISWADDAPERIDTTTHFATAYGVTATDKPLGSLPGELPSLLASGHLQETLKACQGQAEAILAHMEEARKAKQPTDGQDAPPPEEDVDAAVTELAAPEEEARVDSHE